MNPAGTVERPVVSVLLAVRNGGSYLAEALGSIQAQTLRAWELVVVDDGSNDDTPALLAAAARSDARIRVFRQEPLGLVAALNRAAAEARGEFLARMDADDRAHPQRLARQVDFLAAHPEVGVLGTAIRRIGAAGGTWTRPEDDATLRAALLFEAPFAHPTVMLRRSIWQVAREGYREDFRAAEDIDLWERLAPHTRFANLPDVLLDYRVHPGQVTAVATETMARNGARVRQRWLQRLGLKPTEPELARHEAVAWIRSGTLSELDAAGAWLDRLAAAGAANDPVAAAALRRVVARRWFEFANAHSRLGWPAWRAWRGHVSREGVPAGRQLRFAALCALRHRGGPTP
jgi:glycosyltransferase involved in cell wall biosynthesis